MNGGAICRDAGERKLAQVGAEGVPVCVYTHA